jgi:hypothetical protein
MVAQLTLAMFGHSTTQPEIRSATELDWPEAYRNEWRRQQPMHALQQNNNK